MRVSFFIEFISLSHLLFKLNQLLIKFLNNVSSAQTAQGNLIVLALAIFNLFSSDVRRACYLPCLHVVSEESSLMICLADQQTGFPTEYGNAESVEPGTLKKEWF